MNKTPPPQEAPTSNIIKLRTGPVLVSLGGGLYKRGPKYFHRPTLVTRNGKRLRVLRALVAVTKVKAREEMESLNVRQRNAHHNPADDPFARSATVGNLADDWLPRHCPDHKGLPRLGESLKAESARLKKVLGYFDSMPALQVSRRACRDYHAWRIKRAPGHRLGASVDRELQTLSNLFAWAVNEERLAKNPIAERPRFDDARLVRHCTAVMPESDEVFHQIAGALLARDATRALGWQFLLEGLTGVRTCELLACRIDAKEGRPGFTNKKTLCIHRAKRGMKPWSLLECSRGHSPLAECLAAFLNWHQERYNHSPWFIPGKNPQKPMSPKALTHALRRICPALGLPLVTSHGLRAYHVRALRSLGVDDSEISKRLGHRSGVSLVERTYGESEPGWFGSREMDFLPNGGQPAWSTWLSEANKATGVLASKWDDWGKRQAESYQNVTAPAPKLGDLFGESSGCTVAETLANPATSAIRPVSAESAVVV